MSHLPADVGRHRVLWPRIYIDGSAAWIRRTSEAIERLEVGERAGRWMIDPGGHMDSVAWTQWELKTGRHPSQQRRPRQLELFK